MSESEKELHRELRICPACERTRPMLMRGLALVCKWCATVVDGPINNDAEQDGA